MILFSILKKTILYNGNSSEGFRILKKGCPYFIERICSEISIEKILSIDNLHMIITKIIEKQMYRMVELMENNFLANNRKTISEKRSMESPTITLIISLRLFIFIAFKYRELFKERISVLFILFKYLTEPVGSVI